MRTLKSVGTFVAAGGLSLGLISAPAFAAPAASPSTASASPTTERGAGGVHVQGSHVKYAKKVSGKPGRKLACSWVWGRGGKPTLGKVCFQPNGDKFWVKDQRGDGLRIVMRAMPAWNYQTIWDCADFKGKSSAWTRCSFSKEVKDGVEINFVALAYKGSNLKRQGMTQSVKS